MPSLKKFLLRKISFQFPKDEARSPELSERRDPRRHDDTKDPQANLEVLQSGAQVQPAAEALQYQVEPSAGNFLP